MGVAQATGGVADASLRFKTRAAGVCWLVTIVAGACAAMLRGPGGTVANLIATAAYAAATFYVYQLLAPVSRGLSGLAAISSFIGCALSILAAFDRAPSINPLVFFGGHCLLVGLLILRSGYLPAAIGGLMVFAGVGWLSFLFPALAKRLMPYNMLPGILGEASLTIWLLAKGVDLDKWRQKAGS
jgi:hypothetical protein